MPIYRVGNLINSDSSQHDVEIHVDGERITAIRPAAGNDRSVVDRTIDAYAVPGFIDIHNHGARGHDFTDGTDEAFDEIARFHLENGTTTFLASTLTTSLQRIQSFLADMRNRIPSNARRAAAGEQATLAGVHLEGPWISQSHVGAQNPRHVIEPDTESLRLIEENSEIISMVTFSYHTRGARTLLDLLVDLDIVAASGHDEALDEEIVEAFARGMSHLTHIYCNSSSFQRRNGYKHLGSLEMSLITPGVSVEVIGDDRHITRYFWEFIAHNKSVDDIMLVSDSTRGAGLAEDPTKVYKLGELDMVIDDGVAWLSDRTVFAGSTSTMLRMFRTVVKKWGVGMQDAVKMTSANQAAKFGLADVSDGIAVGSRADILFLDDELCLKGVLKSGQWVQP